MLRSSLRFASVLFPALTLFAVASLNAQQFPETRSLTAQNRWSLLAKPAADNSLKLDAAGNPVIAFWDNGRSLKLAHCANPTCSSGTITHTLDSDEVLAEVSLALNAAGNPVISYFSGNLDARHGHLKVAACADPNCSAGTVIATVDGGDGDSLTGLASSLVLDAAGNPIVSYTGIRGLKVVHCGDTTCTSNNVIKTIEATAGEGYGTGSLALDAAGNPVISYVAAGTIYHVRVAHCGDPNCAAMTISTLKQVGAANTHGTSLALDADGNPVVAYFGAGLEVAHCADPNCSAHTVLTSVDHRASNGNRSSMVLDSDGNPVISYAILVREGQQVEDHLAVIRCGDPNCASGNVSASPDRSAIAGGFSSLRLDSRDRPVISYQHIVDLLRPAVYLMHCGSRTCN